MRNIGAMAGVNDQSDGRHLTRQVLEQVVRRSSEGIVLADAQSDGLPVVYANPAYETLTGYTLEELTGESCPLLRGELQQPPELARLRQAVGRSEPCAVVVPDLRKDGTTWYSEVCVEPLYGSCGEVEYILLRQKPVPPPTAGTRTQDRVAEGLLERELGRARQTVANLNRIDAQTGLLRLDHFRDQIRRELVTARREPVSVALIVFEIVEFDVYRTTFGAKAAESCLRMIAAQLSGTLRRAGDLCARYDETVLAAFVRTQHAEQARPLGERIAGNIRGLGLHNPRARHGRYVTVRVGIAACPPDAVDDADALIARALEDLPAEQPPLAAQLGR